jgi:hypothetical protein
MTEKNTKADHMTNETMAPLFQKLLQGKISHDDFCAQFAALEPRERSRVLQQMLRANAAVRS